MPNRLFAILVHDSEELFESLRQVLKVLRVETYAVRTCSEAECLAPQTRPHLIFTRPFLCDGSWVDMVTLADRADAPLNVIVVGSGEDTQFAVSVIERGAFEFIWPPFESEAVAEIVHSAGGDACNRREALARSAVA